MRKSLLILLLSLSSSGAFAEPVCESMREIAPKDRTVVRAGSYVKVPNYIVYAGQLDNGQYLTRYLLPIVNPTVTSEPPEPAGEFYWQDCH